MAEETEMKKVDNTQRYWFHRIDNLDVIPQIDKEKIIGSSKKQSLKIKKINPGDRIFLVTKRKNTIEFFGYTQVDETYVDEDILYGYYESRKKLKLKGIKYFSKPVPTTDMAQYLESEKIKKSSAKFFGQEYNELTKEDFIRIR